MWFCHSKRIPFPSEYILVWHFYLSLIYIDFVFSFVLHSGYTVYFHCTILYIIFIYFPFLQSCCTDSFNYNILYKNIFVIWFLCACFNPWNAICYNDLLLAVGLSCPFDIFLTSWWGLKADGALTIQLLAWPIANGMGRVQLHL